MLGIDDNINWYQKNKRRDVGGEDNEIHLG